MSKFEAIKELLAQVVRQQNSKQSLQQLRKACEALELTESEIIELEVYFEYRNSVTEDYYFWVRK